MPDPAQNVPANLLNHLHLMSTMSYPFQPHKLTMDKIFASLFQAPRIVKEQSPVVWQYLQPPQDGTMFLAWQPLGQVGSMFATDGYVWAEPEITYQQEFNGYVSSR